MPNNADNLLVRRKALDLAVRVHAVLDRYRRRIGERSPSLRAQMARAVDSIVLNIAEGAAKTDRGFIAFLDVAIGSANELETQLELAIAIQALPAHCAPVLAQVVEVRKMTIGLRNYLQRRDRGARSDTP